MPNGLPVELRERIVRARTAQGLAAVEVAELFEVGETTVRRYLSKHMRGESLEPQIASGPSNKLGDREMAWLRASIEKNPYLTSYELTAAYNKRFRANRVHRSTILRAMHKLGFTRKKRPS